MQSGGAVTGLGRGTSCEVSLSVDAKIKLRIVKTQPIEFADIGIVPNANELDP